MNLNRILIGSENPQGLRDYYNKICGKPAFEEVDKLKAAGATVVREPYQPGGAPEMWIATFSDPDNNYFQLMSSM
jgi:predicted enzyme related to lactoylglutathione lyase